MRYRIAAILLISLAFFGGALLHAHAAAAASVNKDAIAVIIGNKDYAGTVPDVDFAHNDAEAMKRFVVEIMGFREGNIIDLRDATKGRLEAVFGTDDHAEGQLHDWVKAGKSDVVVFYSGHGAPGLKDRRGYLVPADADPRRIELTGYPVDLLYSNLAQVPARRMTVFLDACFSGETPKGMIVDAASGILVQPRLPAAAGLTVLTAARRDQVANWDTKAKHGLFTRYLLQGLRGAADADPFGDGNGDVTLAEVGRYLDEEMTYQSKRLFGTAREQRATAIGEGTFILASLPPEGVAPPPREITIIEADLSMVALKNANIRSGPSTRDSKVGNLPAGSEVNVTGEVAGSDWYRVALADGGEGYVWRPLLGEEEEPAPAAEAPSPAPAPKTSNPSEIVIASGPLIGLTLADWLLLSADRLKQGEYVALIDEAAELRNMHGEIIPVERVLQRAIIGDLEKRAGMERVVYAAAYRRQHGSFDILDAFVDEAGKTVLLELEPITLGNAREALAVANKLAPVSGDTPAILSIKARAYHLMRDYEKAREVYGDWLKATPTGNKMRRPIIAAMLMAMNSEPLDPDDQSLIVGARPGSRILPLEQKMLALANTEVQSSIHGSRTRLQLLDDGDEVDVTGQSENGEWYRVALAGGRQGYILKDYLEELPKGPRAGDTFQDCPECPEMVVIPAGEFMMGSPAHEHQRGKDEGPVHRVIVPRPFAMGIYEVTFDEWEACLAGGGCDGYLPSDRGWGRGRQPVIYVNYTNAKSYTNWLTRKTGREYRLPSEAEWEYAARAGTTTRYYLGNTITESQARFGGGGPGAVGRYPPNPFGLHDMHGNVWEWTEDCYARTYEGWASDASLRHPDYCRVRTIRSGSSGNHSREIRSAMRKRNGHNKRHSTVGIRVVAVLPEIRN